MALDRTNLQRIGGVNPQLHIYNAGADTVATVTASGYFNAVTGQLRQGDVIIVLGAGLTTIDNVFVNSATGAATVTTVATEGVTVS